MNTIKAHQEPSSPGERYLAQLRGADGQPAQRGLVGILIAFVALLFVVPLVAQLVISLGWLLRGRPLGYRAFIDAANGYQYVEGMIGSHLGIASLIIVTMLAVRYLHRADPAGLVSDAGRIRRSSFVIGLAVAIVVLNVGYWITRIGSASNFHFDSSVGAWLLVIVLCAPLQAAGEEFLFRGYLPKCLRAIGLGPWLTTVLGALIFALLHGVQDAALFTDRFIFGLIAGTTVLLTGGLEIAIAVHAVNNVFAYGYAALSGGVGQIRHLQTSSWTTTWLNLVTYLLCFGLCWLLVERPWQHPDEGN